MGKRKRVICRKLVFQLLEQVSVADNLRSDRPQARLCEAVNLAPLLYAQAGSDQIFFCKAPFISTIAYSSYLNVTFL